MSTRPSIAAALVTLCESPEPFSGSAVSALFRACILAAGIEWETLRSLDLIERLWYSDTVLSAIEELQDAHEAGQDTTAARRLLLETIDAELQEPSR